MHNLSGPNNYNDYNYDHGRGYQCHQAEYN